MVSLLHHPQHGMENTVRKTGMAVLPMSVQLGWSVLITQLLSPGLPVAHVLVDLLEMTRNALVRYTVYL